MGAIEELQFTAMNYACEAYVREAIDIYRNPYEIANEGGIGDILRKIGSVLGGLVKKAIAILGNIKSKIMSLITDNNLYLSKENREDILEFKAQSNRFTEEFDKLPSVKTLVSHLISRTEEDEDHNFFNSPYIKNEVDPHINAANETLKKMTGLVKFERTNEEGITHLYEIPGKSIIGWIDGMIKKWRAIENELSDSSFASYQAREKMGWAASEINAVLQPYQKLVTTFIIVLGKFQQFIMSRRKPTFERKIEEAELKEHERRVEEEYKRRNSD